MQKAIIITLIIIVFMVVNHMLKKNNISVHVRAPEVKIVNDAPEHPEYRCDGRIYCSQMTSCEEAKLFLENCPGVKMDGDRDGIPCEDQLCH